MKFLLPALLVSAFLNTAHAHPGGHVLKCTSTESKQKIKLTLRRANGTGWAAPVITLDVDGKEVTLDTPDENNNYGTTFHNSPLKVIRSTIEVPLADSINGGYMNVVAIPETVKAFDYEGKPVIWNMEDEKDECYDSNGSATFKGIFHGWMKIENEYKDLETQKMDCELTYNSGMAC